MKVIRSKGNFFIITDSDTRSFYLTDSALVSTNPLSAKRFDSHNLALRTIESRNLIGWVVSEVEVKTVYTITESE